MTNKIYVSRNEGKPSIPNRPPFEQLMHKVKIAKQPFYKKSWFMASAGIAAVGCLLFLIFKPETLNKNKTKKVNSSAAIINPPNPKWDVKYDTFNVNIASGDTITYKGCTKIIFPPNSVHKKNGNPIKQSQIVYREIQNQAEIMSSGIPMMYDSAGQKYLFESAGMFEIRSTNPNEEVNPDISIEVQMCSQHNQEGFNEYKLEESTGQWEYKQPIQTLRNEMPYLPVDNEIKEKEETKKPIRKIQQTQKKLQMAKAANKLNDLPISLPKKMNIPKPEKADPQAFSFEIEASHIPELRFYKNVTFQALPGEISNPQALPDLWDYIHVNKTEKEGVYMITLLDQGKKTRIKSKPVFDNDRDYEEALKVFSEKEAEHKKTLAAERKREKEQFEKQQKEARIAAIEAEKKWKAQQLEAERRLAAQNARVQQQMQAQQKAINLRNEENRRNRERWEQRNSMNYNGMVASFSVGSFGYYNSDRPIYSTNHRLQITYSINGGKSHQGQLYQYYINRNAVMVNYDFAKNTTYINYNSTDRCLLLAILADQKSIAIFEPEKFKEQITEKNQSQITLNKVDKEFKTADDIQRYVKKNYR